MAARGSFLTPTLRLLEIRSRTSTDDAIAFREQPTHGETHKYRDLLLGTAGEPPETFRTRALHTGDREAVAQLKLRSGIKIV